DVAMYDPLLVRIRQCIAEIAKNAHTLGDRWRAVTSEPLLQRLPGLVRHDVEEVAVRLARVVERDDQRMPQPRDDLDLAEKSIDADRRRDGWVQHFDGDFAIVLAIARAVHDRHAAASYDVDHLIPLGERAREARRVVEQVGKAIGGGAREQRGLA